MPKESAYFLLKSLNNKQDIKLIKKELDTIRGIISVSVNHENSRVAVDFDNSGVSHDRIKNKINEIGFEIADESAEEHVM